jgi:hypothetical protein
MLTILDPKKEIAIEPTALQVGDIVQVIRLVTNEGISPQSQARFEAYYLGRIGRITNVHFGLSYPYEIKVNSLPEMSNDYFCREELEFIGH